MKRMNRDFLVALAVLLGGVVLFFLLLYLTGHDPDERPLTLVEWIIAGALVGPGFGLLVKSRKPKGL